MSMTICLVSREYPSDHHTGGIGTYTEKTARALAQLGQNVYVLTEAEGAPSTREEDGVVVWRLAPPRTRPRAVARAWAVARALTQLPVRPDIVQVCEHRAEGVGYALHHDPRTRLVTRLATPSFLVDELDRHEERVGGARTAFIDRLERLQTRRSDAVISPTNALAAIVSRRWQVPPGRITTLPTGVDFAARYASQATALPAELEGQEYLLYFGRLEERKGVHILAEALPQVLATYPRLRVVFAGNGQSYRGQSMQAFIERCNEATRDRLHFYPRLPQRALYPILAHACAVVLPSLWENLANTCLEALDMGKPVVATLGCGFSEVVEDGRSGLLVPPGDVPALRQALLALLADRERLHGMGQAAKERARRFSLATAVQDLLQFYETLHTTPASHAVATTPG